MIASLALTLGPKRVTITENRDTPSIALNDALPNPALSVASLDVPDLLMLTS
jgi:hypothetical protein